MLFNRHVWTDKRILLAIPVAFALRFLMEVAFFGVALVSPREEVTLHPTTPTTESQGGGDTLLLERRIKKINLDGSEASDPMSPLAAAAAFGGAILLVGSVLSILSWRQGPTPPAPAEPDPEPAVRRAAPRSGR